MAMIEVEVHMQGSSDAEAVPVRQISVAAVLRGLSTSEPGTTSLPVEPEGHDE